MRRWSHVSLTMRFFYPSNVFASFDADLVIREPLWTKDRIISEKGQEWFDAYVQRCEENKGRRKYRFERALWYAVVHPFHLAGYSDREVRALLAIRLETRMRFRFLRMKRNKALWRHISYTVSLLRDPIFRSGESLDLKFSSLLSYWRVRQFAFSIPWSR